jgi:23S rRNA (adenine1618-N6)-methyltransferase
LLFQSDHPISSMLPPKREHPIEKSKLHPRNKHRERYHFPELIAACPALGEFVTLNIYNDETLDFFNPQAVKLLNQTLLKKYYAIDYWDIPDDYLCPPIPGRADYIHNLADLIASCNHGKIPTGTKIKCLDIGTGANCIYPLIGHREYGWSFIGTDIDPVSIASAKTIIEKNSGLAAVIELRHQPNSAAIFQNIIREGEFIDLTLCNPPFHASAADAHSGTNRKLKSLRKNKNFTHTLNFAGQSNELWCEGGEITFVRNMIRESQTFSTSCFWYTTLISKQSNLDAVYDALQIASAWEVKTIPMGQGNKQSRFVAWTFLNQKQQALWRETRWM